VGFLKRLLGGGGNAQAPKTLDERTIAEVSKRAADMSAARDTNHYLYVPNEEAANAVSAAVARPGRNITARPAASGTSWLVLVKEEIVVSRATIVEARREFSAATAPYGGEYDGWEAAAV
jgi:hypothetical protein